MTTYMTELKSSRGEENNDLYNRFEDALINNSISDLNDSIQLLPLDGNGIHMKIDIYDESNPEYVTLELLILRNISKINTNLIDIILENNLILNRKCFLMEYLNICIDWMDIPDDIPLNELSESVDNETSNAFNKITILLNSIDNPGDIFMYGEFEVSLFDTILFSSLLVDYLSIQLVTKIGRLFISRGIMPHYVNVTEPEWTYSNMNVFDYCIVNGYYDLLVDLVDASGNSILECINVSPSTTLLLYEDIYTKIHSDEFITDYPVFAEYISDLFDFNTMNALFA
jgi:hypothetical protein